MIKRILIVIILLTQAYSYAQISTSWTLLWSDEFSGDVLNTDNWTPEIGSGGWGNNEWQYYTGNPSNVTVNDGHLEITARNENFGSSEFTSARIISKGLFDFQYGKIEGRIKLPQGAGLWPAFWMLGANIQQVGWPVCGEIDIMEHVNTEDQTHGTNHWYNGGHVYEGASIEVDVTEFHLYGVIWDTNSIKYYVDGIVYFEFQITTQNNSSQSFHHPFFLLLNIAVGGNWPGDPTDLSVFPATMTVDYVRVFQQMPSGVLNVNNELQSVYPVPFDNELNLVFPVGTNKYAIYNAMGEIVESGSISASNFRLDTHDWPHGVYFIHMQSEVNETVVHRIVK